MGSPTAPLGTAARSRLEAVVGERGLLVDPAVTRGFGADWTGRWTGEPLAVVRPRTATEIGGLLAACADLGLAVVPQGGNTGLVGGGVPRGGEVVLSTRRMTNADPVDVTARTITVDAGVTLATVQGLAAEAGLRFGVDLAARDAATIGGMVATNAGGIHVVACGPMARNLRGLEVVLADGSVFSRLGGLPKEATGYDLAALCAGSEGTLGVISRVRLALAPAIEHVAAAALGLASLEDAVAAAAVLPGRVPEIQAIEVVLAGGMELISAHARLPPLFDAAASCVLFLEVGGAADVLPALERASSIVGGVRATAVAEGQSGVRRLFAYRERQAEAIATLGIPHKLDVAVPLDRVTRFLAEVEQACATALGGARWFAFGHLAEGNLHVNVLPPAGIEPDAVDDAILDLVVANGGAISSEHGIGVAKARFLRLARDPADVAAMRAIKDALDPAGILNPGVLFG
jgi:FAD/FMN-containing dehydrogenase